MNKKTIKLVTILVFIMFPGLVIGAITPKSSEMKGTIENLIKEPIRTRQPLGWEELTPKEKDVFAKVKGAEHFVLREIKIIGTSVFSERELSAAWEPYLGTRISTSDLFAITRAITKKYRNYGYITSQAMIPPQQITRAGRAEIKIIEGYVDEVEIHSKHPKVRRLLFGYKEKLKSIKPFNLKTAERYLVFAKETPGIAIKPVLSSSSSKQVGASRLTLVVTDSESVRLGLGYDNRGTNFLGPHRVFGEALFYNFLNRSKTLFMGLSTIDFQELKLGRFKHTQLIGYEGLRWYADGIYSHSKPKKILKTTRTTADFAIIKTMLMYPLYQTRDKTWKIRGEADYHYGQSKIPEHTYVFYRDTITSLRAGMLYSQLFSNAFFELSGVVSKGVTLLGATSDAFHSRLGGRHDYSKVEATNSYVFSLTQNLSIFGLTEAQYSPDTLLVAEEVSFGGPRIGRGYNTSEITGDYGVGSIIGAQYNLDLWETIFLESQVYVTGDMARTWVNKALARSRMEKLASVAIGTNFVFKGGVGVNLEVAWPLERFPDIRKDKARFFVQVSCCNNKKSK